MHETNEIIDKSPEKSLKSPETDKLTVSLSKPLKSLKPNIKEKAKILELETMKLPKIYTPYTYIMYSNKLAEAKEKFKETMKEIGMEMPENSLKWSENLKKGEEILKKSLSVKYLGVKEGQIGILSKRVPLSKETKGKSLKNQRISEKNIENLEKKDFLVNKYSLPHQLHGVFRQNDRKKKENSDLFENFNI